jgi:TRAP-type C4-dicarboxylate transport system substrate-binding protein
LENGQITPADVVVEMITTAKAFGERQFRHILAATPIKTLCKLLGAVLRFVPQNLLSELIPSLEFDSEPIKTLGDIHEH